jgi:hypothetical protein
LKNNFLDDAPGTKQQKYFENFYGPKKGDLVTG